MDVVDRYELIEELGAGGFGRVYRARHQLLRREVALKVLLAPNERDRFLREATILAQLEHPHIVEVFDSGTTAEGLAFLALELLEGETTAQRLRSTGAQPVGEAIWIVDQLLDGLAAAHERGIVHRDLKHPNVFLAQEANGVTLKILDFGISKLAGAGRLTSTGMLLGTPRYMAPEVLLGEEADAKADLWAAGLILYELLLGQPAYVGTPEQAAAAIVRGAPPPLRDRAPGLPRLLYDVVDTALAHDRGARFATADAFRAALRTASVSRPIHRTSQRSFATGMLGQDGSFHADGTAATVHDLGSPRPPTAATRPAKPAAPASAPSTIATGAPSGGGAPSVQAPQAPSPDRTSRGLIVGLMVAVVVLLLVSGAALQALFPREPTNAATTGPELVLAAPVLPDEVAVPDGEAKPAPTPHTIPASWMEPASTETSTETETASGAEPVAVPRRRVAGTPQPAAPPAEEPPEPEPDPSAGGGLRVRSCSVLEGAFTPQQVRGVRRHIDARGIQCPPGRYTAVIHYEKGRSREVDDGDGWSVDRCLGDELLRATSTRLGRVDGQIRCVLE